MRFIYLPFLLSACLVTVDDYGKKVCRNTTDCPGVAGYICASTASWPQRACKTDGGETGCLCEVRFPPEVGGISVDGGQPIVPDAGPPPDYCTEIKPMIDLTCIGTCHGSQMQYPGNPIDFRLDYWEPRPEHALSDGGYLPGVKEKVTRMLDRIYTRKDMPPVDFQIFPTDANRKLFNRWVKTFGAPLGDGGCEVSPGGGGMDAGVDGGAPDAGPVRFATQILPIFAANCNCHTGANTSGTLSLSNNTYNNLMMNVSAGCMGGIGGRRVLPNQPMMSQLTLKLSNNANRCGNFMPRNAAQPLSMTNPAAYNLIVRWINEGAPNN